MIATGDTRNLPGGVVRPGMVDRAKQDAGWDFSGSGKATSYNPRKGLTDTEVEADDLGLLGGLQKNFGIANLDELDVGKKILSDLSSKRKSNQSPDMIVKDILDKLSAKQISKINPKRIASYINDELPVDKKLTDVDQIGLISLIEEAKKKIKP